MTIETLDQLDVDQWLQSVGHTTMSGALTLLQFHGQLPGDVDIGSLTLDQYKLVLETAKMMALSASAYSNSDIADLIGDRYSQQR